MIRVAMVTAFPEDPSRIRGGVAAVSVNLCRALSRLPDVGLQIVAIGDSGAEGRTHFEGAPVRFLGRPRLLPGFSMIWYEPRAILKAIEETEFDLVHVQGMPNVTAWLKCPNVLTIHGIRERDVAFRGSPGVAFLKSRVLKQIERRARCCAPHVISISPYVRQVLEGELTGHVYDIENPVDDSFFGLPRVSRSGRVLYCGMVTNLKNVGGLIRGIARTVKTCPEVHLRIAGAETEPEYAEKCRRLAVELGIDDRVSFLGPLTVRALQEEMSAASCLALCSFQENAPMVIAEAMAAGLPVVASRVGGVPYMVADGRTGRLVEPDSPESISAGLASVLAGESQVDMSAASVALAKQRFRASAVAQRTLEVYRAVLSR